MLEWDREKKRRHNNFQMHWKSNKNVVMKVEFKKIVIGFSLICLFTLVKCYAYLLSQ